MLLTVTQEDIDKGERRGAASCPIANAFWRITKNLAMVTQTAISYRDDNECWYVSVLPVRVIAMVKRYDDGGDFSPISFQVHFYKDLDANA